MPWQYLKGLKMLGFLFRVGHSTSKIYLNFVDRQVD